MNDSMIEKYKKLLSSFERLIINTKSEELRVSAKESYVIFIKELALLEKKDYSIYEEKMKSLKIPEEIIKTTIENIKAANDNNIEKQDVVEETEKKENIEEVKTEIKAENKEATTQLEENKQENEKTQEEKPLKILNIKKSFKSKKELAVLGTTALIGGVAFGIPGLLTLPIAAIIWKLYKTKGITNNKLKTFLKNNNYTIDENTKDLKDANGEIVTEEKIGKAKYEMLKNYLLKLNNSKKEGKIKTEYKKNKAASTLLGSKLVDKLKFFKKKDTNIEAEELDENQEIQKGMGKC